MLTYAFSGIKPYPCLSSMLRFSAAIPGRISGSAPISRARSQYERTSLISLSAILEMESRTISPLFMNPRVPSWMGIKGSHALPSQHSHSTYTPLDSSVTIPTDIRKRLSLPRRPSRASPKYRICGTCVSPQKIFTG